MNTETEKQPIGLIIPPSVFLLDERVFMTLGILKVAAVLEKAGYPVEMLDLSGIENYEEAIRDYCRTTQARVFGITSTTPQMPAAMRVLKAIRRERPDGRVILGGPHVTLVQTAAELEEEAGRVGRGAKALRTLTENYDVLVSGDGETAIFDALSSDAPKVINANDRKSKYFLTNQMYDDSPFPARHLIDVASYHYAIEDRRALSLIAQLGCPFTCGFCGGRKSAALRIVRTRSTENILEEMRQMYEAYRVTGFMFYDDELNVNKKMLELMEGIRKLQKDLKADFRLRGFIKSELFTDEQAHAMREAGFRWLLTGFESGSPRILQNMQKKATREENTRAVDIAKRYGLKVKALMSVGHPGESRETILETHDWLMKIRPDDFDVTIITAYPGTPYYDEALRDPKRNNVWVYTYEKTGDRLYSYEVDYNEVADYYKGDPEGGYKSYVFTDHLRSEEVVELRDFVERDVREKLNIAFNPSASAVRYEHSMGQGSTALPSSILKKSSPRKNYGARTSTSA
jgi:radical SAM superfamily enzyme YgiQ (UPF0313 family)